MPRDYINRDSRPVSPYRSITDRTITPHTEQYPHILAGRPIDWDTTPRMAADAPRLFQGRPHRTSEERRAMDIEAEGLKQKLLASSMCVRKPPPPPAAVLPSQTGDATTSSLWFRPTSKKMPKTRPPGGARKNWEEQYRIVKEKSEQERLAFVERWPRPNCRNEDEIFSELFRASMTSNASSSMYKWCGLMLQEYKGEGMGGYLGYSRLHGSVD
jgi:hypothetical protein